MNSAPNDISQAHEAFYKAISEVQRAFYKSTKDYLIPAWCIKEKGNISTKYAPSICTYHVTNKNIAPSKITDRL